MTFQIPDNHTQCVVCQQPFFCQQSLEFVITGEYQVRAEVLATRQAQGFTGVMQGGLITALHDSAMLHCLFAHQICAMTVKLETRFHHPIPLGKLLVVEAQWVNTRRKIYELQSQIVVEGRVCSTAKSQFIECESGGRGK